MSELTIKIKHSKRDPVIKDISIISDMLVDDLRIIVEEEFKVPAQKQNLIFKGRMLTNNKKLEDYKISNGDTILLVEKFGNVTENTGLNNVKVQTGVGARGQLNYDLLKQPMGGNVDMNQIIEAMKIPEVAAQMEAVVDDPNIINAMMQNPQIKAMCDANPMIKDLMTNREFIKSMLSMENLEKLKKLQEGDLSDFQNLSNLNNMNNMGMGNMFGMPGMGAPMPMFNPMLMNNLFNSQQNMFGQNQGSNSFGQNPINMNTANSKDQLKDKYKNEIETIKSMGFDNEDEIINALNKTNGNVNAAIERLLNGLK